MIDAQDESGGRIVPSGSDPGPSDVHSTNVVTTSVVVLTFTQDGWYNESTTVIINTHKSIYLMGLMPISTSTPGWTHTCSEISSKNEESINSVSFQLFERVSVCR